MAKEIRWSKASASDLESIFQYIARDSEDNARAAAQRLMDATEPLVRFPFLGRVVPEYRDSLLRELIVYSYRIIYKVEPDAVSIIGIIHGARRLTRALRGRKL